MTRSRQKKEHYLNPAPSNTLVEDGIWDAFTKADPKTAKKVVKDSRTWTEEEKHVFVRGFSAGIVGWANRPEEKV